jgi:low affinity Fe/Cu permease
MDVLNCVPASGVILGLPLIVAAILVIAIVIMLVDIGVRNRERASRSVNVPLALRFTAIVIQIFITAIVLICEISLQDNQLRSVFRLHIYWTGRS